MQEGFSWEESTNIRANWANLVSNTMNRMYITMPQLMTSGAPGLEETHQIRCLLKLNLI